MRVRKRVLIICGLILLILYTARVIVVNKNADRVPVYIYDVGETVDFGNDYVDTVEECIDGYAVQVLGYEVVDNYMALVSENVFCTMYPDMPGTSFSLRKGTSMEFELPYPITRTEGCTKEDMQKKAPMLEISEFPNRKLLKAG